jgi:very-short-patch-repair endonuclease
MRKRTPSRGEIEAWKQLRALRAEGFAFRREYQLGRYRADFVCLRRRLIVEVDGPLHESAEAKEHDARRDAWLTAEGFRVLRFKEGEILSSAYWLGLVRTALLSRPESGYRKRESPLPPPPLPLGEGEKSAP